MAIHCGFKLIFVCSLGLICTMSSVQATPQSQIKNTSDNTSTLSILEAWQLALESDAVFRSDNAKLAAQREVLPQARAALLPTLSTSASYLEKDQDFVSTLTPASSTGYDGRAFSYSIELRQKLLNRSATKQLASAKKTDVIVEYNLALTRQSLILRLAQAYFNLLLANESTMLAQSELTVLERQLDQMQQRFNVGLVANTDLLNARASYDQSQVSLALAQNNQSIEQQNLSIIVGQPVDQVFSLKQEIALTQMKKTLDEWVAHVLKESVDLKIANENQKVALLSRDATRAQYMPTVDAFASYSRLNEFGDTDTMQYGLQANWVPFQGGGLRSRLKQAKLNVESAKTDFTRLQQTLTRDAINIYKSLATDVVSIKAQTQAMLSSEALLEATQAEYDVGTRDFVDVLNAQRAVFQARRNLTQARHQWILHRLDARFLASSLSMDQLQEIESWLQK